jgi:drug/metabolite transporter (DMT)-like permease
MQRTQRDGVIYILLSVSGYACLPIFTKNLLARGLEPLDIAVWRFLFTVPVFWLLTLARGKRTSKPLPRVRVLLMGALLGLAAIMAFFGLERLPSGTFVVLVYTYPALVAIFEALMGERLGLHAWIALSLTLVGITLTAPDFSAGLSGDNLPGVLWALADALTVALYMIASSRLLRGYPDMVRASAWTVSGSLILLLVMVLPGGLALPQGDAWLYMVGLAVVSTIMPVFTLNTGIQKLGSTRASIIATFEPVLTTFLALIFLGERMLPIQVLGGALIIASVILLQIRRPVTAKPEQAALAGD